MKFLKFLLKGFCSLTLFPTIAAQPKFTKSKNSGAIRDGFESDRLARAGDVKRVGADARGAFDRVEKIINRNI